MARSSDNHRRTTRTLELAAATLAMTGVLLACTATDPIPIPMPGFDAGGAGEASADGGRAAP